MPHIRDTEIPYWVTKIIHWEVLHLASLSTECNCSGHTYDTGEFCICILICTQFLYCDTPEFQVPSLLSSTSRFIFILPFPFFFFSFYSQSYWIKPWGPSLFILNVLSVCRYCFLCEEPHFLSTVNYVTIPSVPYVFQYRQLHIRSAPS